MSQDHSGKVALVTGGGGGIGSATSRRLAREGAAVAVLDVDRAAAERTAGAIGSAGGRATAVTADVRRSDEIAAAVERATDALGPVTLLVNNAGLVTMSGFDDLGEDEWDLVLDVNLKGMWLVTREVAPSMAEAGGGAIVNLSTIESEVVVSSTGRAQVHYNASKGGVKMLTKAMAAELGGRGIRVNAVAPGPVATEFVSLETMRDPATLAAMSDRLVIPRVGEPDDIAAAISFLLCEDASWITGAQLPVDGGWLVR